MNEMTPVRRMTAKDFPQELLDLYDYYAHGKITKREFLTGAAKFAVAGVTAAMLLDQLSPNYALAQQVAPDDGAIETDRITYPSPNGHGEVNAYMVKPAGATGKLAAVLVIHENRGLNPYIEDVARRLGKAGFLALAPDGLTSVGGYPGNDDEGRQLQRTVDREKLLNDFFAGFEFLLNHEDSTGKVGAVGFCYGGGVVNAIAVAYPELSAGVPFYGRQPAVEDVAKIEAPLMLQHAELDERINAGWPAYEEALKAHGKEYVAHMYQGANHGFHNDTTPRFDAEAAELAEERTVAFFKEHLT
ncbi:YghX family hydrolase [Roseibium alexandrii]|uniref:Dienelactone hydrolase/related enzyme n=1 Tax=Roseibium alexandrii (strain DSM 17067 / NCIMB 14079 / DFL-11) TaxID=244592 RepID=A0A5E8GX44_ROSAD|nr:YghX family hydrolase [Roseibium alexandrii]EEE44596.1 Dienelactone hydrolase/related enzyme [Roseibium alexandrii DFL-11]